MVATWKFLNKPGESLTPDGFGRFDSKVRIPFSGSILLSAEVRAIIDTPEFQHLRGVRQLGPTMFVFPGANHTRFEHSLGVYGLVLRYLERLSALPAFSSHLEAHPDSIRLLVLASLLHDIGHYPYSHWIEELEPDSFGVAIPDHETRAGEIINGGALRNIIESTWQIDVDALLGVISGTSENTLVTSILHSAIDADKVDYLLRDSIHCGVEYGRVIDIERLLDSLAIDPDSGRICVTEKGASTLLSVLACRNIMYMEVYWHKTVRACEAMFKRFFFEFLRLAEEGNGGRRDVPSMFRLSDDECIGELHRWAREHGNEALCGLVRPFAFGGRESLYKPAMIISASEYEANSPEQRFLELVSRSTYSELVTMSNRLASLASLSIPGVRPTDILIEKTPIKEGRERSKLAGFRIVNERSVTFETYAPELDSLNIYLINHKRVFIFCAQEIYPRMKELAAEGRVRKWMEQLTAESPEK